MKKYFFTVLLIVVFISSSCGTLRIINKSLLNKAKIAAKTSFNIYTPIANQVVNEISEIVEKDKNNVITDEDRNRLRLLNDLKNKLDKYAKAHNTMLEIIKEWEKNTEDMPENIALIESKIFYYINQIIDLAKELKMDLPEGI